MYRELPALVLEKEFKKPLAVSGN